MSGSGVVKRKQAMARQAAKLAESGYTHRQIASVINKRHEQVKALVSLGRRLLDAEIGRKG